MRASIETNSMKCLRISHTEIRDSWSALNEADQMLVATDLVEVLRESGVRDVMIYDDDGLLRIQALGEQPPRTLPGPKPGR